MPHNFTLEQFGLDFDIPAGAGVAANYLPDQPGDFAFFCTFHPDQMVGQLTVE